MYCIEILHTGGCETVGNLLRCNDSANWVSIAHRFGHRYDVRNDLMRLERPVMGTASAESHLHLIGDHHTTSLPNAPIKTNIIKQIKFFYHRNKQNNTNLYT